MTTTIEINGFKVRSRSHRRYVVVATRAEDYRAEDGFVYAAFARVHKRSDSFETARTHARRYGRNSGAYAVVVDTATGEVVA